MTHSHMDYSVRFAIDPAAAAAMGTDELRHNFHIEGLFQPGRISLTYTHYDRMIVGGAMPTAAASAGNDQADRDQELPRSQRIDRRQCRRRRQVEVGGQSYASAAATCSMSAWEPARCRSPRATRPAGQILSAQRAGASDHPTRLDPDRRRQAHRPRQPGDLAMSARSSSSSIPKARGPASSSSA